MASLVAPAAVVVATSTEFGPWLQAATVHGECAASDEAAVTVVVVVLAAPGRGAGDRDVHGRARDRGAVPVSPPSRRRPSPGRPGQVARHVAAADRERRR